MLVGDTGCSRKTAFVTSFCLKPSFIPFLSGAEKLEAAARSAPHTAGIHYAQRTQQEKSGKESQPDTAIKILAAP